MGAAVTFDLAGGHSCIGGDVEGFAIRDGGAVVTTGHIRLHTRVGGGGWDDGKNLLGM